MSIFYKDRKSPGTCRIISADLCSGLAQTALQSFSKNCVEILQILQTAFNRSQKYWGKNISWMYVWEELIVFRKV